MMARTVLRVMLLAVLAIVLAGCGGSRGGGVRSTTWGSSEKGVPGIDSGTLLVATQHADGNELQFAVWSDFKGGGVRSASRRSGWIVESTVVGDNDHLAAFKCTSPDGVMATMSIAGTAFDVADGGLFLVSTLGDKPTVAQLKFDVQTLPHDSKSQADFAKSNQQIAEFFRNAVAEVEETLTRDSVNTSNPAPSEAQTTIDSSTNTTEP
jgi:hypothetical protein